MPRKRLPQNKGLPERWRFAHGAYYYQVPIGFESKWDGKKLFRLGKTLGEAYKAWSEKMSSQRDISTIGQLLDRYAIDVIPTKSVKTRIENARYIVHLKGVFGDMPIDDIEPKDIYKYIDLRKEKKCIGKNGKQTGGLSIARREISIFSHAFTKAVEWGYIKRHPFKGELRLEGEKPRTRYVEDWEIVECLSLKSPRKKGGINVIIPYIRLKLITGMRRGDMLRLKTSDLKEDGIHVTTAKTGKPVIYLWSDELRISVDRVISARPVDISPYLFCTSRGLPYINEKTGSVSGWDSMWQRFMNRVLEETKVESRFTEHDLRAKCASDAETSEHARKLLAHADVRMTEKVYRRAPERVNPLK